MTRTLFMFQTLLARKTYKYGDLSHFDKPTSEFDSNSSHTMKENIQQYI